MYNNISIEHLTRANSVPKYNRPRRTRMWLKVNVSNAHNNNNIIIIIMIISSCPVSILYNRQFTAVEGKIVVVKCHIIIQIPATFESHTLFNCIHNSKYMTTQSVGNRQRFLVMIRILSAVVRLGVWAKSPFLFGIKLFVYFRLNLRNSNALTIIIEGNVFKIRICSFLKIHFSPIGLN